MAAKICNIVGAASSGEAAPFRLSSMSGAFTGTVSNTFYPAGAVNSRNTTGNPFKFDASLSSSLYSNDTDTLNPDSISCRFYIKY